MSKMFLDSTKTLHTCSSENCKNCYVSLRLNCHFNLKQLLRFILIVLPPLILAGIVIALFNSLWLVPWLIIIILYFGFIEIRVMCSHCPHYSEPEIKTLKCWANYGSPKIWKYRPGPMSFYEKLIFSLGFLIIIAYSVLFFILENNFIFLGLYVILIVISAYLLKRYYCSYCINFACPLNNVDKETREIFFNKNPIIKSAWKNQKNTAHNSQ